MADAKISALPTAAGITSDDLVVIVNDPNGTPVTQRATAAQLLSYVSSGIAASGVPSVALYNSTTQSISHNTTTLATFDSERYDTDSMHSTTSGTGRITFNTAGKYVVTAYVSYPNDNDTTQRYADIFLNNGTVLVRESRSAYSGDTTSFTLTVVHDFAVNDYIELRLFHLAGAGVNLATTCKFTAHRFA